MDVVLEHGSNTTTPPVFSWFKLARRRPMVQKHGCLWPWWQVGVLLLIICGIKARWVHLQHAPYAPPSVVCHLIRKAVGIDGCSCLIGQHALKRERLTGTGANVLQVALHLDKHDLEGVDVEAIKLVLNVGVEPVWRGGWNAYLGGVAPDKGSPIQGVDQKQGLTRVLEKNATQMKSTCIFSRRSSTYPPLHPQY